MNGTKKAWATIDEDLFNGADSMEAWVKHGRGFGISLEAVVFRKLIINRILLAKTSSIVYDKRVTVTDCEGMS